MHQDGFCTGLEAQRSLARMHAGVQHLPWRSACVVRSTIHSASLLPCLSASSNKPSPARGSPLK